MKRTRREEEVRFLEQVARYREEYRTQRRAAVIEEQQRRHAAGEALIAGLWLPRTEAEQVGRRLRRKELFLCLEVFAVIALLGLLAIGVWKIFGFLMLP